MIQIPLDIPNKQEYSQIKKQDRLIVAYAVLMGASNQEAFMRFNPHYLRADGKGMNEAGCQASRQFWGWGKIKDYRAEYEKCVEEFVSGGKRQSTNKSEPADKRKDKALNKLVSDCLDAIDSNASLDPEVLKDFVAMAKALGVLKDEQEKIEPARRYLPTRCRTECAYRLFVESHIESGEIISECDYCRTRKFAEEQGWKFDPTKNLNLPIEESNG